MRKRMTVGNTDHAEIEADLFPNGVDATNRETVADILEQYKIFVDTMEKVVARRQVAGSFFLSVNTLFLTGLGFLVKDVTKSGLSVAAVLAMGLAGILVCVTWRRLMLHYGQLNAAKFKVIHLLEKRLPAQLFTAEWTALDKGKDPKKYVSFAKTESIVPLVFAVLYGVLTVIGLVVAACDVW